MCVALMEVARSGELGEVLWWAFLLRLWCIDQEIYGQQEVGVVGWSSELRPENYAVSAESWYQNTLVREAITQGEVKKEESRTWRPACISRWAEDQQDKDGGHLGERS